MKNHISLNQSVQVSIRYPVVFCRDVFSADREVLASLLDGSAQRRRRVMVVVDSGVAAAFPEYTRQIEDWFAARAGTLELVCAPEVVQGGEGVKNDYRRIMNLVDQMLEYHLCRHSVVIVIGGGAVLDAAGFAVSLVHRGLRLLRMPSTSLAQDDAGIGVKNGMNLHGGKNTVGVFAAPFAVLNDFALLEGLPDEHWRAGISEAFKVAMIKDKAFYEELCEMAPRLGRRDQEALERVIVRCAELHLEHIAGGGDPFELGSARPLDFGHWSAHKLETLSQYRLGHGQAVAVGIALDSLYAAGLGWISGEDAERTLNALRACGFELEVPELGIHLGDGTPAVLQGLREFQEHLGGELTLTLPRPIGSKAEIHEVDEVLMCGMIDRLLYPAAVGG